MISSYQQNNNLLNEIRNINSIDILNQIEDIIVLKKQNIDKILSNEEPIQLYLNQLIYNAKSDFDTNNNQVSNDIDTVIEEMRGDYGL